MAPNQEVRLPNDHKGQWKNKAFCIALAALLLAPNLFTGLPSRHNPFPVLGLARVFSGDEPHYLVILNSLLNDGDLDLANNYADVNAGGIQAGKLWAADRTLDHQTLLLIDGRRVHWRTFYSVTDHNWKPDANGVLQPVLKPGASPPPPGTPEFSTHQYGGAFLLAPLLFPLRGTTWLEPAALLCSGLPAVGAMLFYRMLLRCFTEDSFTINAVTLIAFLGSPLWFYGRSLFLEGLLTFCLIGTYALSLRKNWSLISGILIGVSSHAARVTQRYGTHASAHLQRRNGRSQSR